jgi:hypothetical protein
MNPLAEMQEVERRLPDALNEVTDRKGDNLLRREGESVALLPEASRLLGRLTALGMLRDLARVVEDLKGAYTPTPETPEPDWNRLAQALAFVAMRRAGQAVNRSFRATRAAREEGI